MLGREAAKNDEIRVGTTKEEKKIESERDKEKKKKVDKKKGLYNIIVSSYHLIIIGTLITLKDHTIFWWLERYGFN